MEGERDEPSAREDASEAASESGDAVGGRAILARSARAVASVDMGVGDCVLA